jgi:hypothetical protein
VAFELGPLVEAQEAVVRQRHLTGHGHLTTADHADVSNGMEWGAKGTGRGEGSAITGEAGDARDAGGLPRCRQAQRWQEGGGAPRQPRRAHS